MFLGPSGIGKTTQAKLWSKYKKGRIVCNDRIFVRKDRGKWYTYGCPIDGSEPVNSNEKILLACLVILEKGQGNFLQKIYSAKAIASLMSQLVIDTWDIFSREKATELLISLIEKHQVFIYKCTKDREAVNVLERELLNSNIL